MKKILLPLIGSGATFSIAFFVLTGKVLESMIAAGTLIIGLMLWEEIK